MKCILFLITTIVLATYVSASPNDDVKVAAYTAKHGLKLSPKERATLLLNLPEIEAHNAQVKKHNRETGENEALWGNGYSHLTHNGFKEAEGLDKQALYAEANPLPPADANTVDAHRTKDMGFLSRLWDSVKTSFSSQGTPPASFDWSSTPNVLYNVTNQGACGSCWAMSSMEGLRSAHVLQHGQLPIKMPSVQQLIDCSTLNNGCDGGWAFKAFDYIKLKNGIDSNANYPYTAVDGNCTAEPTPGFMGVASYSVLPWMSASALRTAVQKGPVVATICGGSLYFKNYAGGIMTNATACGSCTDHSVLVVGWGTQGTTPYWKIQNSWGTGWGEKGFAKLLRDTQEGLEGMCFITRYSTQPVART